MASPRLRRRLLAAALFVVLAITITASQRAALAIPAAVILALAAALDRAALELGAAAGEGRLRSLERELHEMAFRDPLTGLPNRARLLVETDAVLAEAGAPAVGFLDPD